MHRLNVSNASNVSNISAATLVFSLLLLHLTSGFAGSSHAQSAAPPQPHFSQFEVSSVKENKSDSENVRMNFPLGPGDAYAQSGGIFRVANMPLLGYVVFAYKLSSAQSSNLSSQLPAWARSAKYDIEASVSGDPTKDEMRAMMRALLEDRFKLQLHSAAHPVAVLNMVLARTGKLGPTLKPHPADDPKCLLSHAPDGFFSPCGIFGAMPGTPVKAAGRNIPLQMVADNISNYAGKRVVDDTGLSGTFDLTLEFVPDLASPAATEANAPSFLEALSEQIGVKLVPGRGSETLYSLDRIDRPSPN